MTVARGVLSYGPCVSCFSQFCFPFSVAAEVSRSPSSPWSSPWTGASDRMRAQARAAARCLLAPTAAKEAIESDPPPAWPTSGLAPVIFVPARESGKSFSAPISAAPTLSDHLSASTASGAARGPHNPPRCAAPAPAGVNLVTAAEHPAASTAVGCVRTARRGADATPLTTGRSSAGLQRHLAADHWAMNGLVMASACELISPL